MTFQWKRRSPHSVRETLDRFEQAVMRNPQIVRLIRIDQQRLLRSAGFTSPPCEMLLIQNPILASAMFSIDLEAAFELPIRILAWQDPSSQTWLRITDPAQLDRAANLNGANGVIETINSILGGVLESVLPESSRA